MDIKFNNLIPSNKEKNQLISGFLNILNKGDFINGKSVKKFEDNLGKLSHFKYVISCNSGSDAILIALMSLNLKENDEVIIPNFGYVSAIESALLLKLKPVLVDINYDDFNISVNEIKKAITKKTKVIIPIHLFGQNSNLKEIYKIAHSKDINIIEDSAQSVSVKYYFNNKKFNDQRICCVSFFPTKNLGCYGDGGAILTNNRNLAIDIKKIKNHGQSKKYVHDLIGINSRLDTIQANILNVKLQGLIKENNKRKKNAKKYKELLSNINDIILPIKNKDTEHIYHQFTIKVLKNKRDKLHKYLKKHKIESIVYYPNVFSKQKAFKNKFKKVGNLMTSIKVSNEVLSLPINSKLTTKNLIYISDVIKKFFL